MKERGRHHCSTRGTNGPATVEQMHFEQRGCWCHNNDDSDKRKCCTNHCYMPGNDMTTTTTTTTAISNTITHEAKKSDLVNNNDADDEEDEDEDGVKSVEGRRRRVFKDEDNDDDVDETEEEEETALIGATYRKNFFNIYKNNVNTESSYLLETTTTTTTAIATTTTEETATPIVIGPAIANISENHNNLFKRPTNIKAIKTKTTAAAASTTINTAAIIPKSVINLNKTDKNVCDNAFDDDDDDYYCGNDLNLKPETATPSSLVTETTASTTETYKSEIRPFSAKLRHHLLRFWHLTFVEFCDAVTVKSSIDSCFRRACKVGTNNSTSTLCSTSHLASPSSSSLSSSTSMPSAFCSPHSTMSSGGKFKWLLSKKIICLFLVCLFFSCTNRIEARPNTSTPSNTIASNDGLSDDVVTLTSNPSTTVGVSSALPLIPETKGFLASDESKPFYALNEESHNEDDDHAHDRYPLSQVDFDRVKTPFIIGIWILSASIAKIGFHMTPKLHLIFPESCLLIVVGVIIGVVLYFCTEVAVSPLTPNTFFFYMLPPIILDAGYFMPNRMFFDNLGTILLMAVVGTIFNIATIGGGLYACGLTGIFGGAENTPKLLDTFIFASLISAVDPVAVLAVFEEIHVNEILYIVVFGESLLNDAVTVVMYHMMEVYNEIGISNIIAQDIASGVGSFFVVAVGGTVIGIIWGFLTGLLTRFTDHVRVIEPIFIFVMAYLAYLNAEIFHMSGILAITFCGITMKNYVESNISIKSHTTVKYALKMLSSSSETIIFMFLGVATVNNNHVWNTAFVILTILFCSVFRVVGVIILTALANRFRLHKLSRVDQFVMSYGGLRGAVAFALVLLVDERVVKQKDMFVTTTIAVIYFTVFLQGITIKPLVKFLNVKRANKRKPTMNERIHERFMDHLMAGIEDIVGKTGNYNVRDKFKRFDNRFIRPLLIRDLKGAEPKIIETYSKLTMRDAMEVMRRNPSTIGQITGTESMSALFRNYTNACIGGSPSLTNLDNNISRNLDMHELDYNPSKKDLTDAKIHHMLAEELKPYRRASIQMHRRLSYSRHAVDDRDLSTQVNYKMQMNFRRMFNDRKHHKRSKRGGNKQPEGVKQNHVSFHDFQQNGTAKQFAHDETPSKLNEVTVVGANDDWDDGLTFTAKSSPDSDRVNNNSLIAHIQNLPGFDASKARIVQHYAPLPSTNTTTRTTDSQSRANAPKTIIATSFTVTAAAAAANSTTAATTTSNNAMGEHSPDCLLSPDVAPTAAELILPWRRDRSYQSFVSENPIPEEDRNFSRDSDGERRVATPTATESQLPWKRQEDENSDAVQQNEFPAWASNKEYLAYNSPSATFLGGINKPKAPKSVIGLFRRESSGSKGIVGNAGIPTNTNSIIGSDAGDMCLARGSDPSLAAALSSMIVPSGSTPAASRLDKRSQSIAGPPLNIGEGHSGQFPVTASHRRNVRRGSMLELSGDIIPEETYHHGQSKSLCEPTSDEWDCVAPLTGGSARASSSAGGNARIGGVSNGREPLLPKLTPRAQIRKMGGGLVSLAALGGSSGGGAGGSGGGGGGGSSSSDKNQVTTALLAATGSSDYDDEDDDDDDADDDEDEDFELYDDDNIVVTTTTKPASTTGNNRRHSMGADGRVIGGSHPTMGATTTTSIRLTRNNDESII